MRIYFVNTTKEIVQRHHEAGVKNFLVSYYYEKQSSIINAILDIESEANIMLDSGAYTAFTHKEEINLKEYIQFCLDRRDEIKYIVALDDINDPEKTKSNYESFLDAGIKDAIPTFHVREPFGYLDYYCRKADYIAFGGLVQLKLERRKLFNWASQVIDRIPIKKKIHLFGINNFDLILRYARRITSADSSSTATRFNSLRSLSLIGLPVNVHEDTTRGRMPIKHIQSMQYYTIWRLLDMEKQINEYAEMKSIVKTR